ncbi:MBL fold metallo-hydrolase, partial [Candidatus Gracilibacteria bacterium]|nr:MBL fold metallo-hydrolase [Candidatus Gracilibacteria bacterium]
MSLRVISLASGSKGNALLVSCAKATILVDCGLSLRAIERQLAYHGVAPESLCALLLTHEHGDHTLSAGALARRYKLPVVCNAETAGALGDELNGLAVELLPPGQAGALGPFTMTSFLVPHDAAAPVGYRIAVDGMQLGLAIDLGSWTEAVAAELRGCDLLIIEANHDREQLQAAPYPFSIRQRIFGPLGHLDNIDAGALIAAVCTTTLPRDIWLAHLSEQANSAQKAVVGVGRVLKMAGIQGPRLRALPRVSVCAPQGAPIWESERMLTQRELFEGARNDRGDANPMRSKWRQSMTMQK